MDIFKKERLPIVLVVILIVFLFASPRRFVQVCLFMPACSCLLVDVAIPVRFCRRIAAAAGRRVTVPSLPGYPFSLILEFIFFLMTRHHATRYALQRFPELRCHR
jgi:hypothetical protein